jgi:predicted RecB family nuclease
VLEKNRGKKDEICERNHEGSHHIGSSALRKFIENIKVSLVICGHCHSNGGLIDRIGDTTIVNVASNDNRGSMGKFAVIKLHNDGEVEVRWHDTRELLDQHSVDRIWGVGNCYSRQLANSGITTIKELASHRSIEALSCSCEIPLKVLWKFQLRARSILEGKILQVSPFAFPEDKIIFIDIETDLACNRVWLIGLLVDGQFTQLYADDWRREKEILIKFLDFLNKYPDYVLVSYSGTRFDYRVLLQALKRQRLKTALLESHEHFDLNCEVKNCFIFPNQSFALKELGAYLQYPFKFPELNGMIVAQKYMKHAEDGEPLDKQIIEYNEDDVKVLPFIISTLKSKKLSISYVDGLGRGLNFMA